MSSIDSRFLNKDSISGAVGAFCCVSAGTPFDTIKARLQAGSEILGPFECLTQAVKEEGFHALFKGFNPALSSAIIENVVVWTVNSQLREIWAGDDVDDLSNKNQAVIGAATGAFSAVCICPAEVVKVRLQTSKLKTKHAAFKMIKNIGVKNGPRGFFFGLVPTLLRDVPYYFLFFGAMETYKSMFNENSIFHAAVGGGVAGSFGWAIMFPMDVLKTRQQVNGWTTAQTVKNAFQGRVSHLYRGFTPAVARAFPANFALVLGVELSRSTYEWQLESNLN